MSVRAVNSHITSFFYSTFVKILTAYSVLDWMLILLLNKKIDYVLIGCIQCILHAIIILSEHKHLFSINWNYLNSKNFSFWLTLYYKGISNNYDMVAYCWYINMHKYVVYKQNYKQALRPCCTAIENTNIHKIVQNSIGSRH